jgi:hypothetical protein
MNIQPAKKPEEVNGPTSGAFKWSLALAILFAIYMASFNLIYDMSPHGFQIGGPLLKVPVVRHSDAWGAGALVNGVIAPLIMLKEIALRLLVVVGEGLAAWLVFYLFILLLSGDSEQAEAHQPRAQQVPVRS